MIYDPWCVRCDRIKVSNLGSMRDNDRGVTSNGRFEISAESRSEREWSRSNVELLFDNLTHMIAVQLQDCQSSTGFDKDDSTSSLLKLSITGIIVRTERHVVLHNRSHNPPAADRYITFRVSTNQHFAALL